MRKRHDPGVFQAHVKKGDMVRILTGRSEGGQGRILSVLPRTERAIVEGQNLAGLYIGTPEEAWEAASTLSDQIHIVYKPHPFKSVLSCAPAMYDAIADPILGVPKAAGSRSETSK